jgi:membrane-anchored protein YejM (alkaline phosphatase superfamily)
MWWLKPCVLSANTSHKSFSSTSLSRCRTQHCRSPNEAQTAYQGAFAETPYLGNDGYLPHPTPKATYAAMITRMDRQIGAVMALLKELDLDENTPVMFSSDNGATFLKGPDTKYFESVGKLRGLKGDLYEGGICVPMIARWPGKIPANSNSNHASAFWDVMPTLAETYRSQNSARYSRHFATAYPDRSTGETGWTCIPLLGIPWTEWLPGSTHG